MVRVNQSYNKEQKDEESPITNTTDTTTNRIRDIEAGVDLADIEVIPSSTRAQEIYSNLVKSAAEEILWIFPTTNAFIRQEKIGGIQLAQQAAKERNVKVRILVPANSLIEQKIQQLKQSCHDGVIDVRDQSHNFSS
jgi:hypothetical protein